jgi:hypothetical protein
MSNSIDRIYLVYSMGKVGSSAIYLALKKELPESLIFHVHFLSRNKLENLLLKANPVFHHNITKGQEILYVIAQNPDKILTIITLTREPIIRDISDLFQNWSHLYNDIEYESTSELSKQIDRRNHYYALNWFDSEFKEYLGFDIYQHPFNKELGFDIFKHRDIDILCLKQEKLKDVGSLALKTFLGMELELLFANQSSNKKGSQQYDFLKNNYIAPPEKIKHVYGSKYIKHFYTDEEISEFIAFWSKTRT